MTDKQLMLDGSENTESTQKLLEQQAATIYKAYPRQKGPDAAIRAITTILKKGKISYQDLLTAVRNYAVEVGGKIGTDPKFTMYFVPYPATWFLRGSWKDEPDPPARPQRIQPVKGPHDH